MKINFGKLSKWIVFWIKKKNFSKPYNDGVSAEKLDLKATFSQNGGKFFANCCFLEYPRIISQQVQLVSLDG